MKNIAIKISIFLMILFCCDYSIARAEDRIEFKAINYGMKIAFYSDQLADFNVTQNKKLLIIEFSNPFHANLDNLIAQNNNIFKNAYFTNNHTLIIELRNDNTKSAKFISDKFTGINITNTNPSDLDFGFIVEASRIKDGKMMIFPWQKNVASAVFYREGYLWVIFNEYQIINIDNIKSVFDKQISDISILPNKKYSILRFKGDGLDNIKVTKQKYSWIIQIMDKPVTDPPANPIIQYKTPSSKGIFFPIDDIIQNPILVMDPVIGDNLQIVLCYNGDSAVPKTRNFIDFNVLKTAQGFVLHPISDKVSTNIIIPGIEITTPYNNFSSAEEVKEAKEKSIQKEHVYSFLPFDKWSDINPADIIKTKDEMEAKIKDSSNKSKDRFELVQFLLGVNLVHEASGELKYIDNLDPKFSDNNKVYFIKAVIEFMRDNYSESQNMFDKIKTTDLKEEDKLEVDFWQDALNLAQRKKPIDYNFMRFKNRFLKNYPQKLYYQLAYLDLDYSINNNDLDHADELFSILRLEKPNDPANYFYVNSNLYYFGQYLKKQNNISGTVGVWQKLTKNVADPFNRARAGFALTKLFYESKKIKIEEAIDQINDIKAIWRGDLLEFDMNNYLADLYLQQKDYISTLRLWKLISARFANYTNQLELTSKMGKLFYHIFGPDGASNDMSDLKAIALFYEFKELTPVGSMGDKIVQNLVDKLVDLDLLKEAEDLLYHQVNFRLNGADKIACANKLAKIYLIDKKPEKALSLLDDTEDPSAPKDLQAQRRVLRSKALLDTGEHDFALSALENDYSDEANFMRGDIYWDKGECSNVIKVLEPLFTAKLQLNRKFTPQETSYVLELILSNIRNNDLNSAKKNYTKFANLLDNSNPKLKNILDFVAKSDPAIDHKELESSLGIENIKKFLEQYKQELLLPN